MIHLLRDFYINADRFGYTVGILSANNERERENRAKSIILRQSRYYTTLSVALASTAEIALRVLSPLGMCRPCSRLYRNCAAFGTRS